MSSGGLFFAGLRLPTSARLASSSVRISLRPVRSGVPVGAGASDGDSVGMAADARLMDVGVDNGSSRTGVSDGVGPLAMVWDAEVALSVEGDGALGSSARARLAQPMVMTNRHSKKSQGTRERRMRTCLIECWVASQELDGLV